MIVVTTQGILLGLSTGLFCLGTCGPVFVPLMMAEKRGAAQSARVIGELALGRLVAYLIFGAAVGYLGMQLEGPAFQRIMAGAMVVLSFVLLLYAATRGWPHLPLCRWANGRHLRFPIALGFLTGLNVCPPFLLAISTAFGLGSIGHGMLLFGGFFLGTSVYLLLLLPLGYLGRWQNVRLVALLTAVLSGAFFFLMGITRWIAFWQSEP
jgi:sulfite exporter TauE/SafE